MEKRPLAEAAKTLLRRQVRRLSRLPATKALFDSRTVRWLRKRLYRVSPHELERIGAQLEDAGVDWWVTGGWGIDLLLGEQTRPHNDLDVWIEAAESGEDRAVSALHGLGYRVTAKRAASGRRFPIRSVLRHPSGQIIDLIMITMHDEEGYPALAPSDTTIGHLALDDRISTLPCADAAQQVQAHLGYKPQARDFHDMRLLCASHGIDLPPIYARHQPSDRTSVVPGLRNALSETVSRIRGTSSLLFLVPEAQELFDAVGGGSRGGIPAHITVLYPFVPPYRIDERTLAAIGEISAVTDPFEVSAPTIGNHEFTTFVTIEPADPITELTHRCATRWPEHPPYGNRDLEVPPHITLAHGVLPEEVAGTVDPLLPLTISVDELVLMTRRWSGRWRVQKRFPFRGTGR